MNARKLSEKPFAQALRVLLDEEELSLLGLERRIASLKRGRGLRRSSLSYAMKGTLTLSAEALELIAEALGIQPTHFAEYRLELARRQLDPRVIGLRKALKNAADHGF